MHLLEETLTLLERKGKTPDDVQWVGLKDSYFTWQEFTGIADFNYYAGYGTAEIPGDLVVVGSDWWLERGEYDGLEWWEFKTLPSRPDVHRVPDDLRLGE